MSSSGGSAGAPGESQYLDAASKRLQDLRTQVQTSKDLSDLDRQAYLNELSAYGTDSNGTITDLSKVKQQNNPNGSPMTALDALGDLATRFQKSTELLKKSREGADVSRAGLLAAPGTRLVNPTSSANSTILTG